ncbi:hypothetical protein [Phenylobacterium sp.]|uniref:hypothetical protein n=1 Tax=Phenylobacterium sp. TaxID=1871053 RepID=UPI003934CB0F
MGTRSDTRAADREPGSQEPAATHKRLPLPVRVAVIVLLAFLLDLAAVAAVLTFLERIQS